VIGAFEGDLIRPLGLVTLYFAYAEGEVDELLAVLNARQSCPMSTLNWTVGQKISRALLLIEELAAPNLNDLVERLKEQSYIPGNKYVRIDPDDFVEAGIEQVHNGLRLYIPPVTVLQALRLQPYLRVGTYPAKKRFVGDRIE